MRVRMLGTGSSDGWPNPWCRCRSCAAARTSGRIRRQTSAPVDGRLLIELGHDGVRAAVDLSAVVPEARPRLDDTVDVVEVSPGERLDVCGYDVRALPATDTGLLGEAALATVENRAYDAVLASWGATAPEDGQALLVGSA